MNPFLILSVPRNADDATIRRAYLDAVRQATPESDPEGFKRLTEAYDRIRDEDRRHRHVLFGSESPGDSPFDAYLRYLRLPGRLRPLPFAAMKDHLRSCLKS